MRLPLSLTRFDFDQAYLDRLISGDPPTEQHFARYFGDLLNLKLRSRLRSPALVEDARQETFRRVLTTLKEKGGLASAGSLGAFVNSVANNVLFECYRSGKRADQLPEDHDQPDEDRVSVETGLMAAEQRDKVRQALASLPEKEREILRWLFFEERDKDEVCRMLNVDRNYLRVLVHRAKGRFREVFQAGDEG
jgi:RNA polymerase sigma-70 factor (ECF subfamily)